MQRHELEQRALVIEGVGDLASCGAWGHGEVQAPPHTHLVLQDGGQQEGLAVFPA